MAPGWAAPLLPQNLLPPPARFPNNPACLCSPLRPRSRSDVLRGSRLGSSPLALQSPPTSPCLPLQSRRSRLWGWGRGREGVAVVPPPHRDSATGKVSPAPQPPRRPYSQLRSQLPAQSPTPAEDHTTPFPPRLSNKVPLCLDLGGGQLCGEGETLELSSSPAPPPSESTSCFPSVKRGSAVVGTLKAETAPPPTSQITAVAPPRRVGVHQSDL